MITLDFETYSECDLKKCGAWVYSKHPSTEVLCLYFSIDDGPVQGWIPNTGTDFVLDELFEYVNKHIFEAHNVFFELCIWNNCCTKKYNFPFWKIKYSKCCAAKAAAFCLPRDLERVGTVLELTDQKDNDGSLIMKQLSKPRKPSKKNPNTRYTKDFYPEKFERLYSYCEQDVRTEIAASKVIPDLSESEQELFYYDQIINFRGIKIDIPVVKKILELVKEYNTYCCERIKVITNGYLENASRLELAKQWVETRGYVIDSLDKAHVSDALKDSELPDDVREFLVIRQQLSKSSVKKYTSLMNISDREDHRARGILLFHGAGTGRWAGKMFQPHNLPRGSEKDPDMAIEFIKYCNLQQLLDIYGKYNFMDMLSSCIRGMVISSSGNMLGVSDYSSIEARLTYWYTGDKKMIQCYIEGKDAYKVAATDIYKKAYDDITKDERQLGKQAVLGLGYGMGWKTFMATCLGYGMDVSEELATFVVDSYRDAHKEVTQGWKILENTAKAAILNPGKYVTCKVLKNTKYTFDGENLYCILPSGRRLSYLKAGIKKDGWRTQIYFWGMSQTTNKWCEQYTYGGKLMENVIQALSRDLLAIGIKNCEKYGYPVVLHVHDEIVVDVNKDTLDIKKLEELMCDIPDWASGLPMGAEGFISHRYRK